MAMKNFIYNIKFLAKLLTVFTLALFQVSFFLKPVNSTSVYRGLAQDIDLSEVSSSEEEIIDGISITPGGYSMGEEISEDVFSDELDIETVDISSTSVDLIPEVLPEVTSVKEALANYTVKSNQCLIRLNDFQNMTNLTEKYKSALSELRSNKTASNKETAKIAFVELADQLVKMNLLQDFRTSSSSDSDLDISSLDLGLDNEGTTSPESSTSVFLDVNVPEDLKQIGECHTARLAVLKTEEEKKAYYDANIAPLFVDGLRENIDSKSDVQDLANSFYTESKDADKLMSNQYGVQFAAQTHAKASLAVNAYTQKILQLQEQLKTNPSDPTLLAQIETEKTLLSTELVRIGNELKTLAQSSLITNPEGLEAANFNIDIATSYWASEALKITDGSAIAATPFADYSNTITPTAAGPGVISVFSDGGLSSTYASNLPNGMNLDPNNGMLSESPLDQLDLGETVRNSDLANRGQGWDPNFTPTPSPRKPVRN